MFIVGYQIYPAPQVIISLFKKMNMYEAKSRLSKLGKLAWEGEEIIITEAGKPYLRLVPYGERLKERKPGGLEARRSG